MGRKAVFLYLYIIFIAITFALAIITISVSIGSRNNPNDGGILPILGLGVPLLIFANLICLLYWNIRWKAWAWIPLIAILANYQYIESMYQLNFKTNKTINNAKTIRIISYNVHGFRSTSTTFDIEDIVNYMATEKADIICLQEFADSSFCKEKKIKERMKDFPYYYIKTNSKRGFELAIFSKFPITNKVDISFKNSLNGAMWADIRIKKSTLRIFNCHLQTTNINQTKDLLRRTNKDGFYESKKYAIKLIANTMIENAKKRADQVDLLRQKIDTTNHPIVVCGDFNDTPTSYAYHKINEVLKDGFVSAGSGFGNTFRYMNRLLRIDYLFDTIQIIV